MKNIIFVPQKVAKIGRNLMLTIEIKRDRYLKQLIESRYSRIWRIIMKRLTKGSIIEIHVHHEYYVYAQSLKNSFIAIFDGKYSKPVCSTKELNTQNVLFIICVSISDMIKDGKWLIRGKLPINQYLEKLPLQFIQDALNPHIFFPIQL